MTVHLQAQPPTGAFDLEALAFLQNRISTPRPVYGATDQMSFMSGSIEALDQLLDVLNAAAGCDEQSIRGVHDDQIANANRSNDALVELTLTGDRRLRSAEVPLLGQDAALDKPCDRNWIGGRFVAVGDAPIEATKQMHPQRRCGSPADGRCESPQASSTRFRG